MLSRLFVVLALLITGCGNDVDPTYCGDYTMDGIYIAHTAYSETYYDADGNPSGDYEGGVDAILAVTRTGCASNFMGGAWTSTDNAIEIHAPLYTIYPLWETWYESWIDGVCTKEGCEISQSMTAYQWADVMFTMDRSWSINLEPTERPF